MNNKKRKNGNNLICPICGLKKLSFTHDFCCKCNKIYGEEVSQAWGQSGEGFIARADWKKTVLMNLSKRLGIVSAHLDEVKREYQGLRRMVENSKPSIVQDLISEAGAKSRQEAEETIGKTVFGEALRIRQKNLFNKSGGARIFAELKVLEAKVESLKRSIEVTRFNSQHANQKI